MAQAQEIILTADDIGSVGEAAFKLLCTKARIVANKSIEDKAGWDYVLDLPVVDDPAYDMRSSPKSCYVQIKSVQQGTSSIKLKLNMAERLVKYPGPSFIFTPIVNDFSVVGLRVFHLKDLFIDRILKRLRSEVGKDGVALNGKFIKFSLADADVLDGSGESLLLYINNQIPDMHKYIEEKRLRLFDSGFEGGRLVFSIPAGSEFEDNMIKGLLGLDASVPVEDGDIYRSRFGIELVESSLKGSAIKFAPEKASSAIVLSAGDDNYGEVELGFDYYFLPSVLSGLGRGFSLKSKVLSIFVIERHEKIKFTFDFNDAGEEMNPSEWRNAFLFMWRFSRSGNKFDIVVDGIEGVFPIVVGESLPPERCVEIKRLLDFSCNLILIENKFDHRFGAVSMKDVPLMDNAVERISALPGLQSGSKLRIRGVVNADVNSLGVLVFFYFLNDVHFCALFKVVIERFDVDGSVVFDIRESGKFFSALHKLRAGKVIDEFYAAGCFEFLVRVDDKK